MCLILCHLSVFNLLQCLATDEHKSIVKFTGQKLEVLAHKDREFVAALST